MHAWLISLFGDEAHPELDLQLQFTQARGLDAWDARNADGRNVLDFDDEMIGRIRSSGVRVNSIGSPVNKVELDFARHEAELEKLDRAIRVARALDTRFVRIFSPVSPPGAEARLPEILTWLRPMVDRGERADVVLLHENDATFFGYRPDQSQWLFSELGGPNFRAVFDFANTVLHGFLPMRDWFPWLHPHLASLHIKDASFASQTIVPAGEGEGQILETLRFLKESDWSGTLSLEPHLQAAGPRSGFSGPELCAVAHDAVIRILKELEV